MSAPESQILLRWLHHERADIRLFLACHSPVMDAKMTILNIQIFFGLFTGIRDNSVGISILFNLIFGFLKQSPDAQRFNIGVALQNDLIEGVRKSKGCIR